MDAKQVIQGITVLMLAGAALEAAYAETAATEPAVDVRAVDAAAAPEEAKGQASASDAAAIPAKAAGEAAGPEAGRDAPATADAKPYSIQRVLSGAGDLFERAKNFVTQSVK